MCQSPSPSISSSSSASSASASNTSTRIKDEVKISESDKNNNIQSKYDHYHINYLYNTFLETSLLKQPADKNGWLRIIRRGLEMSITVPVLIYYVKNHFSRSGWGDKFEYIDYLRDYWLFLVLLLAVCFSLFIYHYGVFIFDEARSAKNHPHKHLYTRIRGVWYDLANFDHPGGPIALNLTKDRDATALFESHHLLASHSKLFKILSKYKVDDTVALSLFTFDPRDDGAHYNWNDFENNIFVQDLKQILLDYFSPIAYRRNITLYQAVKATPKRWLFLLILGVSFVVTLHNFILGHIWALFIIPHLAWVLIANFWHDSLHFSLSSDWRVNAILPYFMPILSSPWVWYHQHVIGHHAYTNIGHKDPDLAHAPQLMREHKSIKWRKTHLSQRKLHHIAFVWCIAVSGGLQMLSDIRANLKSSYNNVVPYAKLQPMRLAAHIVGKMVYVFALFVWPFFRFSLLKATLWVLYPSISFSLSFMINSQINHLTEDCTHASDDNFYKHQIITAQNFGKGSWFCQYYSGGLNYQIEHHLFPFVNHCHLPYLAPEVKKICLKHGVPYHEASGYVDALKRHLAHTKKMGEAPPKNHCE